MKSPRGEVLVVAATARELVAPGGGWRVLQCGVGPVDAAVHTAAALATLRPVAILHVGIAGVRAAARIPLGALVIGEATHYEDLGVGPEWAPRVIAPPAILLAAARRALPEAHVAVIGTSGRVGGSRTPVEAMEGFAVLRAAALAGIPAIEVRAISNYIEEPDRARWEFAVALEAIAAATPRLVEALVACVS